VLWHEKVLFDMFLAFLVVLAQKHWHILKTGLHFEFDSGSGYRTIDGSVNLKPY